MNIHISLYHVTPITNRESIAELGVSPVFSQGKRQVAWLAEDYSLAWALAHVAHRRDLAPSALMVCSVAMPEMVLRRTRWAGVWTCPVPAIVTSYHTVDQALRWCESLMLRDPDALRRKIDDIPF